MRLTLATYNIHACIGRDGRLDPDRTVEVVRAIDADVAALQEVHSHPDGERDFLAELAEATGLYVVAGPTLNRGHSAYGNVLLTRLPVLEVRRVDLSLVDREPRGALDVDLDCGGEPFQVIATHLGLHPWERRFQIRRLLHEVDTQHSHPVVMLGDINEWFAWGRPLRWLHAHFGRPPAPPTFPSAFPLFALDRVWVMPREQLIAAWPYRSRIARVASDHLPLVATLWLG